MPRRRRNWLDPVFEFLFGELAALARLIFHHTTVFIFLAACIYLVRYVIGRLFEPTDEAAGYLHVVDTYGILLLLSGFGVWVSIDIIAAIVKHLRGEDNDGEEEDEV